VPKKVAAKLPASTKKKLAKTVKKEMKAKPGDEAVAAEKSKGKSDTAAVKKQIPAAVKKKMSKTSTKALIKQVKKEEKKGVPLTKNVKAKEAKLARRAEEKMKAMKVENQLADAKASGKDPKKALEKSIKKEGEKEAAKDAKPKISTTQAKINEKLKKSAKALADEERGHQDKIMKKLPAGKGLRKAFQKIEDAKVTPPKGASNAKLQALVKKDLGSKKPMTGLTRAAKAMAVKMERDKATAKGGAKKSVSPKKLIKMVKKIEKAKAPGQTTKEVYGMSSNKIAKKLDATGPNKKNLNKDHAKIQKAVRTVVTLDKYAAASVPNKGKAPSSESQTVFELSA